MARTRHKGKLWVLRMMLRQGYQVRPWAFNEKRGRLDWYVGKSAKVGS